MKKRILYVFCFVIVGIVMFFIFEQVMNFVVKSDSNENTLVEISYVEYTWGRDYRGMLIHNDGSIYNYRVNVDNITSKKIYRVMYSDMVKLKKYINDLDGEFEEDKVNKSTKDSNKEVAIYVYRRGERVKIYAKEGNLSGRNNSEMSKKIIKILKKYDYSID